MNASAREIRSGTLNPGFVVGFAAWDRVSANRCLCWLLGLTLALYATTLTNGFLNLDDKVYVYGNPVVLSGLNMKSVMWALTTTENQIWHPVTWLTFLIETQLFGANPSVMHLT